MKAKDYTLLLMLVFLGLYVYSDMFPSKETYNNRRCGWEESVRLSGFYGKIKTVLEKDRKQHNQPTITLENGFKLQLSNEESGFFFKVKKSDIIEKKSGSLEVKIIRNTQKDTIVHHLDYLCQKT